MMLGPQGLTADGDKHALLVLYFYPAAFTQGCTIEAHDFAEASDKFQEDR